jgi:hypothetical protein
VPPSSAAIRNAPCRALSAFQHFSLRERNSRLTADKPP